MRKMTEVEWKTLQEIWSGFLEEKRKREAAFLIMHTLTGSTISKLELKGDNDG